MALCRWAGGNGGKEAGDVRAAIAEVREDFVDPGEAFECHCEVLKASFISFTFLQGNMVCVCVCVHMHVCIPTYVHIYICEVMYTLNI